MNVTNTHDAPLGLPTGQVLEPHTATPVHNWAEIKKNATVAAWLKAGVLKESGEAAASASGTQTATPDKAELHAKLEALGVEYDKRAGVAKLQQLVADAEKAKADTATPDKADDAAEPQA